MLYQTVKTNDIDECIRELLSWLLWLNIKKSELNICKESGRRRLDLQTKQRPIDEPPTPRYLCVNHPELPMTVRSEGGVFAFEQ